MDELEQIKEMIETFKETLVFLVEQEKVRGEEVAALNEKIESVNDILVNQIINPSIEAYNEEQYQGFKDKYGEQLGKFDETLRTSMNDPEYDSTREAWDELQALPEEEREGVKKEKTETEVENGEDSGEEVVEEETEEEETNEVDPELQKELEDYLNK